MIFIFLFCCEKAHDNKEFSRKNSKPCHESKNRDQLSRTLKSNSEEVLGRSVHSLLT